MGNKDFILSKVVTESFVEGYGVIVHSLYEGDDEFPEVIADISVEIVRISEADAILVGNVWCVPLNAPKSYVPIENFQDVSDLRHSDTHDLRTRWFATLKQAAEHSASVESTWRNPEPWRNFVKVD